MRKYVLIILLIVACSCGYDSERTVLGRRYNNFLKALPQNISEEFINKNYDQAKILLEERMDKIENYKNDMNRETRMQFIRAKYSKINDAIKDIPQDDLEFNKKMFKIIDYECIPTFSASDIIDYFKENFRDKLEDTN